MKILMKDKWVVYFASLFMVLFLITGLQPATAKIPDLYSAGISFDANSHIVSTAVFQWFVTGGGQQTGPWRPMEGNTPVAWTGQPDWWQSQIKQMMLANIDVLYVHVARPPGGDWYSPLRRNFLTALGQLRAQGYDVPKVVPWLDLPSVSTSFNVGTTAGKDGFVNEYVCFFNDYFETNTDPYADSYLAQIDGRVALNLYATVTLVNPNSLTSTDVESRLATALGANHPIFDNGIYMIGNALSPLGRLSFSDELVSQYGSLQYYTKTTFNGRTAAQISGGYWDKNIRTPGNFLPRDGGVHFETAWNTVLADSNITRTYVEGWNEYDEGSGIYAANPGPPYIVPPNPNTDTWSDTNDPFEYIHTNTAGARQFNDYPDRDSKILWNDIPACMEAGKQYTAYVVVRNQGDLLWNESNQYRFSQNETIPGETLFGTGGQTRWTIDGVSNEVPFYGGVFRGRPVTFKLTLQAPMLPGTYVTHWGMLQESTGRFGEQMTVTIEVTPPISFEASYSALNDMWHANIGRAAADGWSVSTALDWEDYMCCEYSGGLSEGLKTAYFDLKISDVNGSNDEVVTLEVIDNSTTVIATRNLYRSDFDASNTYKKFALDYYQEPGHYTQFRTIWHDHVDTTERDVAIVDNYDVSYSALNYLSHVIGSAAVDGWSAFGPNGTNYMCSGGPSNLPEGLKTVYFDLKIDDVNSNNNQVAYIEVYDSNVASTLAIRNLYRSNFYASNTYQKFKLDYYQEPGHPIHFRTMRYSDANLTERMVGVVENYDVSYSARNDMWHANIGRAAADGWSVSTALDWEDYMCCEYSGGLSEGLKTAYFDLKISDVNGSNDEVVTLEVIDNSTTVIATRNLYRSNFCASNTYQKFKLDYYQEPGHYTQFRTIWHDHVDTTEREVGIIENYDVSYSARNDMWHAYIGRAAADGWSVSTALDWEDYMCYANVANLPESLKTAYFDLKISDVNGSNDEVVTLEVIDNSTTVIATRNLYRSNFCASNTYQRFALDYYQEPGHYTQFRTIWHDHADTTEREVGIIENYDVSYSARNDMWHANIGRAAADGWSVSTALDWEDYMCYAYVANLSEGPKTAYFDLKISDVNGSDDEVVTLEVIDDNLAAVIATRVIYRSDFDVSNTYQRFALDYYQEPGHPILFRTIWHDHVDTTERMVGVE